MDVYFSIFYCSFWKHKNILKHLHFLSLTQSASGRGPASRCQQNLDWAGNTSLLHIPAPPRLCRCFRGTFSVTISGFRLLFITISTIFMRSPVAILSRALCRQDSSQPPRPRPCWSSLWLSRMTANFWEPENLFSTGRTISIVHLFLSQNYWDRENLFLFRGEEFNLQANILFNMVILMQFYIQLPLKLFFSLHRKFFTLHAAIFFKLQNDVIPNDRNLRLFTQSLCVFTYEPAACANSFDDQ